VVSVWCSWLQVSTAPLYAAATHSPSGLLAVGGVDKVVSVHDPRKWNTLAQWKKVG
jgi:hypothetical protein